MFVLLSAHKKIWLVKLTNEESLVTVQHFIKNGCIIMYLLLLCLLFNS